MLSELVCFGSYSHKEQKDSSDIDVIVSMSLRFHCTLRLGW
ncbi:MULTISPECIES: nucleotidyltransferase domain-containing protein [unclassified Oceanobacillus]